MAIFQYGTLFGLLAILLFQIGPCLATRKSSLAYCEGRQAETCCMRFPRAMDIEKFKSQVSACLKYGLNESVIETVFSRGKWVE